MPDVAEIIASWQQQGIRWVRFELPDMHGTSRSKTVPIEHAASYAQRGLNMYGGAAVLDTADSVVPGTLYNEEVAYRDQFLYPDPDTAGTVPWVPQTARFICDARWQDGTPLEATPRQVFRRALERAHALGFDSVIGFEYEFYLLRADDHSRLFDRFQIFNTVRNHWVPTISRIIAELPALGVSIITANCEYAPSQWEINFRPGRGIQGPDIAYTFKNGVKEIAKQDGYLATFMSKPFAGLSGSGCHTHLSLVDRETGENVFGDDGDPLGISTTCRQFIAGVLRYAKVIDALAVPTVNCHRRRRKHTFSPTNISWGIEDRSAMIRVKNQGPVGGRHIEYRAPSALANPNLVGAALLQAGLRGIEERLDPGTPSGPQAVAEEDPRFEPLPRSLDEALSIFESDPRSREFFGDEFVTAYVAMRRHELARFADWVTDWERHEYLELY